MKEIILEKRYPRSRVEDITDAFMRGYEVGKEQEHRWWSKLCANCDGAIGEPQPSKILEAYSKGFRDGAEAIKGIEDEPQTCSVSGRPYSECADCEHFRCTADEPQTELKGSKRLLKGKDEPQKTCSTCKHVGTYKCYECFGYELYAKDEQSGKE